MTDLEFASDKELLLELHRRIKDKIIETDLTYFFNSGEIRTGLISQRDGFDFGIIQPWDIETSAKCRIVYKGLIEPIKAKQENQKLLNEANEIIKAEIL